jgi:hypothetical protein
MKNIHIILVSIFVINLSCTSGETDGTVEMDSTKINQMDSIAPEKIDTIPTVTKSTELTKSTEDKTNLLLYEKISLGISYEQLKEKLPTTNPLHAEDHNEELAAKGLQESVQEISFLSYKGKLEFNFKNNVLIRYSIVFNEPNEKKGNKLYSQILDYYGQQLGAFEPVSIEEDNYYAQLNTWYLNPDYLLVAYNLNTGNITIAAQTTKPGQQQ